MNLMQGARLNLKPITVVRLAALLAVFWIPVIVGRDAVAGVASLSSLASGPSPYLNINHFGLLYLWSPLVCISAMIMLLSPGFLITLLFDGAGNIATWFLNTVAVSLVLVSLAVWCATATTSGEFIVAIGVCHVAATALLLIRLRLGRQIAWLPPGRDCIATLVSVVIASWLMVALLTPKLFWEDFNGDGVHSFEAARLLLHQPFPFWPAGVGELSGYPGTTTMLASYPMSWFLRLFGSAEGAARLPFVLYISSLFAAVVALAEFGRAALNLTSRLLIWVALAVFVVAVGYSDSYSPYSADIALPAAQHTFHVVLFLGAILAYFENRFFWMMFYLLISYVSLPTTPLLIGFWLIAMVLVWRPLPVRKLAFVVGGLVGCMAFGAVFPMVLRQLALPLPGIEHGLFGLAKHFAYLNLTDWHRFLFVIVPGGGLPFFALFFWRRQDLIARSITLVTLAYFFFFYFQARTALHYYIPSMLLPLVVFWRTVPDLGGRLRVWVPAATAVSAIFCFALSLPEHWTPYTTSSQLSAYFECRYEWYGKGLADLNGARLIGKIFAEDWKPGVPEVKFGGAPYVFHYYSHVPKTRKKVEPNYVIAPSSLDPPVGSRLLGTQEGWSIFVKNEALWKEHQSTRPNVPAGSNLYWIPREIRFLTLADDQVMPGVINLKAVLSENGFDVDGIRGRLGQKQK